MIYKDGRSRLACVGIAVLVVLTLVACGSPRPLPARSTGDQCSRRAAQPAATQPPVKETVVIKETVVVEPTRFPQSPLPPQPPRSQVLWWSQGDLGRQARFHR